MRGVSANFESAHREGSTNDIWNNLYTNNAAGDQIISDMGYVDETFNAFFLCKNYALQYFVLQLSCITVCLIFLLS